MTNEQKLRQQNSILLVDAYRIFFDAHNYEPAILIGYCRLVKDIFVNEMQNAVCDIVLHELMAVCKKFKDNSQFALIAKYGLTGKDPLTFDEIGNILYMTPSSVSHLCSSAIGKLKNDTLAKQYSLAARKRHMNTPSAVLANTHICTLNLSTKTYNALCNANIFTLRQFTKLTIQTLQSLKGVGETAINEILEKQKELQDKYLT